MKARFATLLCIVGVATAGSVSRLEADVITARDPELAPGMAWDLLEVRVPEFLPRLEPGWARATFWDLRPRAGTGRRLRIEVGEPVDAGLEESAAQSGADRTLCREEIASGRSLGCELFDSQSVRDPLRAGSRYVDGTGEFSLRGRAVAEGVALLPVGPVEVLLLEERITHADPARGASPTLRYRFLTRSGKEVARLEGHPGASGELAPERGEFLVTRDLLADDGIEVRYSRLSAALEPGTVGFLQYSLETSPLALNAVNPAWTGIGDAIGIDATSVVYQPDPSDPGSSQVLADVWDFTGLDATTLTSRTFNTTRADLAGNPCGENCAALDTGATPADGTFQSYLKIDNYDQGVFSTRDIFELNDNDTGADPSIDVVYVSQDELNTSDWTQICFQQSAGGAERLLRFFQFFGADPSSATLALNDSWTSGAWTECDGTNGLRLTAASICGAACYPACSPVTPYGRGRLAGGAGFSTQIVEDGWVHVPAGNYVPALLMRQDTDVEAGIDFISVCALGNTPNRAFDYFWVQEYYGLLALLSSVSDETIPPDDWSAVGNVTDRADFTWGPFPPYQTRADACVSGTRISWDLPADGSNLGSAPQVSNYGYVVSWGSLDDPEELADWDANPNHTPLPGEGGYLLAPAGSEPTSHVVTSWGPAAMNATVTTALTYEDPDVLDQLSYRSAAFYKVVADPSRLDGGTFTVGDTVAPFVSRSGGDLQLDWPAVAGAGSYLLRVWDLDTGVEIPCPAGLDCNPATPQAVHGGGASSTANLAYRAFAVDPCGEASAN